MNNYRIFSSKIHWAGRFKDDRLLIKTLTQWAIEQQWARARIHCWGTVSKPIFKIHRVVEMDKGLFQIGNLEGFWTGEQWIFSGVLVQWVGSQNLTLGGVLEEVLAHDLYWQLEILEQLTEPESNSSVFLDFPPLEDFDLGEEEQKSARKGEEELDWRQGAWIREELSEYLEANDILIHPQFGRCRILRVLDGEKVLISPPGSRSRKLLLNLFQLQFQGEEGSRKIFKLAKKGAQSS